MSLHEYEMSSEIARHDFPFYSLVMELMRRADTPNATKLQHAFPEQWAELRARYNAPGGLLPGEKANV